MADISIITTTFNAETTVQDCLASVQNQQDVSVEHIIIDGESKDRTVDIVRSNTHVSRLISELDNGIYDAMNKGISLANGHIIGILNADDFYANDHILSTVVKAFQENNTASCYGDLQYIAEKNSKVKGIRGEKDKFKIVRNWKSGNYIPEKFYWGWMPPHPTFFVQRFVYEKYGLFDLGLGSAADYEIMLRFLVKHRVTATYIPEVLIRMRTGGVSNASLTNRIAANKMDRKAWQVNGLKPYPWTLWMKPMRKIGQWIVK